MSVIAVLAIVMGLLYGYSNEGWNLFSQTYTRGLSQVKAKLAIKVLTDELREANKNRISINKGFNYGIPFPDDAIDSSAFIYFTKPKIFDGTGDIIAYDYILYYFAKPKTKPDEVLRFKKRIKEKEKFYILKSVKFINQSKKYTEDKEKNWPFLPPILEIYKSSLPEDETFIQTLKSIFPNIEQTIDKTQEKAAKEEFLDHFALLQKDKLTIPISGNFSASSLTDPFSKEEVNIFFGQEYKSEKPIKIKVAIEEPPLIFGLMSVKSEFEVQITPRN